MKPTDFFIGVIDLFAVLVPGAILTFAFRDAAPHSLRIESLQTIPTGAWIAFLLASYLVGHLVFMLGSRLDFAYDKWRKRRHPKEGDQLYDAAHRLRNTLYHELAGAEFSSYKWARCYATMRVPSARGEIDRFEATSKFFRGLIVVVIILAAYYASPIAGFQLDRVALCLLLAVLSFLRYCDQRWKSTEITYAYAVMAHKETEVPDTGH